MLVGDYLWLYGGSDANGPTGWSSAARSGSPRPRACRRTRTRASSSAGTSTTQANLPVARTNASGWGANGAIYLAGGNDGSGPQTELYWAVPTTTGDIPEWKHLTSSDLPVGLEGAAGRRQRAGRDPRRRRRPASTIAGHQHPGEHRAPATVLPARPGRRDRPGLKIEGEIGQQLGYLNAAVVGTVDFILLILIGWAFAHKAQTRALIARILRRGRRH